MRRALIILCAAVLPWFALTQRAEASSCAGVVTTSPFSQPPVVYQLSSLSVNTPTYRVGISIPAGWPQAPFANPVMAPTLVYSFTTTYLGPTYFGWVNTGYLTGAVHYFGQNALIMVSPDYPGYVSSYGGDCPIP